MAGGAWAEPADVWLRDQLGLSGMQGNPEVVRALRQLNDADLQPVLTSLLASNDPRMRVEARLGLASLRNPARVLLSELAELDGDADRTERRMLIAGALDGGWLDARDVEAMLSWDGLETGVKLLLWLDVIKRGDDKLDSTGLIPLLDAPDERHAKLAALLLYHQGHAEGKRRMQALFNEPDTSPQTLALLLQTITSQHMQTGGGFALSLAENAEDAGLRELALRTALGLGTPGADRQWQRQYNSAADVVQKTRLALLAMRAYPGTPTQVFAELAKSDDAFIVALGRACLGVSRGTDDAASELRALLDFDHAVASAWVLSAAGEDFPPEFADAAYRHLVLKYRPGRPETRERRLNEVMQAVEAWLDLSNGSGGELLQAWKTRTDPAWREAVMLGLLRHGGFRAGAVAEALDARDVGPTRVMHAIVLAKQADVRLDAEQHNALRDGADGTVPLGDGVRAQACWLWLKQTGKHRGIVIGERVRSGV